MIYIPTYFRILQDIINLKYVAIVYYSSMWRVSIFIGLIPSWYENMKEISDLKRNVEILLFVPEAKDPKGFLYIGIFDTTNRINIIYTGCFTVKDR